MLLKSNLKTRFRKILVIFSFVPVVSLAANSYTNLKDPLLISRFDKVSEKIMCQCGCNLPLNTCNHRTCGAWALRSVIEKLLLEGKSNEFIVQGFVSGFGPTVQTSEVFSKVREPEYEGMQKMLEKGFGQAALSEPDSIIPGLVVISGGLLIAIFMIIFIRKKYRRLEENSPIPKDSSAEEHAELMKKIYTEED